MAVDSRRGQEACPCPGSLVHTTFPPRSLPLPQVVGIQRNRPRDPAECQSSADERLVWTHEPDRSADEGDLRKVLDIEEVGAAKVRVPIGLPAPYTPSVDLGLDPRGFWLGWIELEHAVDILEVASDMGDHHVPHAELSGCVPRLKHPSSHAGSPPTPLESAPALSRSIAPTPSGPCVRMGEPAAS